MFPSDQINDRVSLENNNSNRKKNAELEPFTFANAQ